MTSKSNQKCIVGFVVYKYHGRVCFKSRRQISSTAVAEKKLLVSDDISIASFSGVLNNVETRPELTSVAYDNALLAEKFLDTFEKQIKLKQPGREYLVDTVFLDKQKRVLNLNLIS